MSVVAIIAQSWFAGAGGSGGGSDATRHDVHRASNDPAGVAQTTAGDRETIARIRAGNSAEFDALVLRVFPLLSRVATRLVGSRADGEEIAQEILGRVWIHRETLPGKVPLTVYLLGAVRRRALNTIRDRRTADRFQAELPAMVALPTPDASLIANERHEQILSALNALTPRHRLAVELRYGAVASYAEISAALGVSSRAAEQIVRRALVSLRRELGEIDL